MPTTKRHLGSTTVEATGSLAGTVLHEGRPLAGARVCAALQEVREPACTTSDARGRYELGGLTAGTYLVIATSDALMPGTSGPLCLGVSERRTGVELVMKSGGMKLSGTVLDIRGGPVAHARVIWGTGGGLPGDRVYGFTETDDAGQFVLWGRPGPAILEVAADGYADQQAFANAPARIEVLLTPEAVLAGIVVDQAGHAVPDAIVTADALDWVSAEFALQMTTGPTRTDQHGMFRLRGLRANRYAVTARTERGYGRSDGSVGVGIAQTVDGIRVTLFPAFRVSGSVTVAGRSQRCEDATVTLYHQRTNDRVPIRRNSDGTWIADGVPPGTYGVGAHCRGYTSKLEHRDIDVTTHDVIGLTWEVVSRGDGVIRGRVLDAAGRPVVDAVVSGSQSGENLDGAQSGGDGRFELAGVPAGEWELRANSPEGILVEPPTVAIRGSEIVERDLVLSAGASLAGTVVDPAGLPVARATVELRPRDRSTRLRSARTDLDGRFRLAGLLPDSYRVTVEPSVVETSDGDFEVRPAGQLVTLRGGEATTVTSWPRCPREPSRARSRARPAPKRTCASSRRTKAATRDAPRSPATTALSPSLGSLPGMYTVRAVKAGSQVLVVEHVAAGTTEVRISFADLASITGRVVPDGPVDSLTAAAVDANGTWSREEHFYRTSHFTITGVPPGRHFVTVHAGSASKVLEVEVASGQRLEVGAITLDGLVAAKGRVIDAATHQPLAGASVAAYPARGGATTLGLPHAQTGADGRFELARVPTGGAKLFIYSAAGDEATVMRDVAGSGVVELGDVLFAPNPGQ